ncbi:MAG: N-carbamoyl-D-amino-acid hydrolase, partial [Actinobacteria bacterium]|nr:N-carbamoyl-D-amino-acid hydrolase [Actinomycetota bacterium]
MTRLLKVAAAQLGPIQRTDDRQSVVKRLVELLRNAHSQKAELVVFPELALTTFFPRWFVDDISQADHWYETQMPSPITLPLFEEAKSLGVGFCLGYAELTPNGERFNTQILVERNGDVVAKYRKVHIPGHETHEPDRPFQHAERYYFKPSDE